MLTAWESILDGQYMLIDWVTQMSFLAHASYHSYLKSYLVLQKNGENHILLAKPSFQYNKIGNVFMP